MTIPAAVSATRSVMRSVMLRHPGWVIMIVITMVFGVEFATQVHQLRALRREAAVAALAASNAIAERDSTRNVARANQRVAAMLGDSVRVVEKRVVQVAQTRDALDMALGGERRASYQLKARVDSLSRVVRASVAGDTGTRRAEFVFRRAPYSVSALVEMPPAPDSARMAMRVGLDPIPLTARLRCLEPDSHGVRAAALAVQAPTWAQVSVERVEQAEDVCVRDVRPARARVTLRPVMVGFGLVSRAAGWPTLGYFIGTGLTIQM